jgi:hypothetical protein
MPIYEYYCEDNHTIYQFYAKTMAQGQTVPKCPDNPAFRLKRILSTFAISSGSAAEAGEPGGSGGADTPGNPAEDARLEAAMGAMEQEFSGMDENDPRAMARMMRRMAEVAGEKIDGEMEEVVRKLEEGADPDSLEEQLGGGAGEDSDDALGGTGGPAPEAGGVARESRPRFRAKSGQPRRDPVLHDYE